MISDASSRLTIQAAEDILRANFAPWVLALGLTVAATGKDTATLSMPANPALFRTGGILSGQALMALGDTAMVIAFCAAVGEFRPFPTVDVNTSFLRPSSSGIIAVATVLRLGKTMGFGEARLFADTPERQLVASVTGTYAIPPR